MGVKSQPDSIQNWCVRNLTRPKIFLAQEIKKIKLANPGPSINIEQELKRNVTTMESRNVQITKLPAKVSQTSQQIVNKSVKNFNTKSKKNVITPGERPYRMTANLKMALEQIDEGGDYSAVSSAYGIPIERLKKIKAFEKANPKYILCR